MTKNKLECPALARFIIIFIGLARPDGQLKIQYCRTFYRKNLRPLNGVTGNVY